MLLGGLPPGRAAESAVQRFDLPAGEATEMLKLFGVQAKREIMFPAEAAAGIRTNAVVGSYAPREALDRMVERTGLTVAEDAQTGALMIFRASTPKPPGAAPTEKTKTILIPIAASFYASQAD